MLAAVRAPDQSLIGTVLDGRYRIRRVLASGGMGAVYEAEHLGLGRSVAVKVMHPLLSEDAEALARFEREARAVAGLGHPNIVQMLDFHRAPGEMAWIVMELVPGVSLGQLLKTGGAMEPARVLGIALPLLSALERAHAAGVVHRDLKPSNVVIADVPGLGEVPTLIDFGIAKMMEGAGYTRLTRTGTVLGTPQYMAPEQALGSPVDARADLYSVGVIVYAMLTGVSPFRGDSVAEVLHAVLEWTPPAPSAVRAGVPNGLDAPVMRAIAKAPADRFATAREMADALRAGLAAGSTRELGSPPTARASVPGASELNTRQAPLPVTSSGRSSLGPRTGPSRATHAKASSYNTLLAAVIGGSAALVIVTLVGALGFAAVILGGDDDPTGKATRQSGSPPAAPLSPTAPATGLAPGATRGSPLVAMDATMLSYLANASEIASREQPGSVLTQALGYGIDRTGRVPGDVLNGGWMFTFRAPGSTQTLVVQYFNPAPRVPVVSTMISADDLPLTSSGSLPDSDVVLADVTSVPGCRDMEYGTVAEQYISYLRYSDSDGGDKVVVGLTRQGARHAYSAKIRNGRIERMPHACD